MEMVHDKVCKNSWVDDDSDSAQQNIFDVEF